MKKSTYLKKSGKIGFFNYFVTLILLAILVFVNLAVRALPAKASLFDVTTNSVASVSDKSVDFAQSIREDVTLYLLSESANADRSLTTVLRRYADANARIRLKYVDPVKEPDFAKQYTETTLSDGSVIVVSDRRFRVIDASQFSYYYDESTGYSLSGADYEYIMANIQQYYTYYTYYGQDMLKSRYGISLETLLNGGLVSYFQGERVLTSAIEYVTLETIPHGYILEGHGETALPASILQYLADSNLETESLNLVKADAIPADANALVLVNPQSDLTDAELSLIRAWMQKGGSLLLVTAPGCEKHENLMALTGEYGFSALSGTVFDNDADYHSSSSMRDLFPKMNEKHAITYLPAANKFSMLMPSSHAIAIAETAPDNVTCTALATTSSSAYRVENESRIEENKQYTLGACAENEKDGSKLVWFSSADAFTEANIQSSAGGNYYYLYFSLAWMSKSYTSAFTELPAVAISSNLLTVTAGQSTFWLIILAVVLPLACLGAGLAVWIRRRRR